MSCRSQSQRAATVSTSVEPGTSASRTSVSASCAYVPTASCVSATSAVSVLPLTSTSNVRLRTSWRAYSTPAMSTLRRPASVPAWAAREVAVAVVARVGERERPVEGARCASETKAQVLTAEAPGRDLGDDLARLPPPPRDHVDRAAERVAPEEDGRAADHLDPLHVLERDQVEVHLLHRRLVEPHAVEEDAEALRQSRHRRRAESSEREVRLEAVPLLVLERGARKALEDL